MPDELVPDLLDPLSLLVVQRTQRERGVGAGVSGDQPSDGLRGDGTVLVLAEQLSNLLHLLDVALGGGAEHRDHGLGDVAGLLAGDPGGVPVVVVAFQLVGQEVSHAGQLLEAALHERWQYLVGGSVGQRCRAGNLSCTDQRIQQGEVARGVHGLVGSFRCLGEAGFEVVLNEHQTGGSIELSRQCTHTGDEMSLEHLGVARLAEHAGDPAELSAQVCRPLRFDQRRKRLQPGAQPAGGDAKLVHRVGQVAADPGVLPHQHRDVGSKVVANHECCRICGCRPTGQRDERRELARRPERPSPLGAEDPLGGAGLEQQRGDDVEVGAR